MFGVDRREEVAAKSAQDEEDLHHGRSKPSVNGLYGDFPAVGVAVAVERVIGRYKLDRHRHQRSISEVLTKTAVGLGVPVLRPLDLIPDLLCSRGTGGSCGTNRALTPKPHRA